MTESDGKNKRRGIPSSDSGFTVAERGVLGMRAALIGSVIEHGLDREATPAVNR